MFLRSLKLTNILSFGASTEAVEMGPLNVLIGPNGSGKSNFIEAIGLLKALPSDLTMPLRRSGGAATWPWKGLRHPVPIRIDAHVECRGVPIEHLLFFDGTDRGLDLVAERIRREDRPPERDRDVFYRGIDGYHGPPIIEHGGQRRVMTPEDAFNPHASILAQRVDPVAYPVVTALGEAYSAIRLYRDWTFGRDAAPRQALAEWLERYSLGQLWSKGEIGGNRW